MPGVQTLLDRAAIRDVLMRYFAAVDRVQIDVVRSCFTDDVHAQYEGRPPVRGVDALIAQIPVFGRLESGEVRVSTHFAGNLVFHALSADHARTECYAFAFLVNREGSAVAMRSLRYLDRLRREGGEWKIFARVHTLDWSAEAPCTFARAFAAKVNDFPADWPVG